MKMNRDDGSKTTELEMVFEKKIILEAGGRHCF